FNVVEINTYLNPVPNTIQVNWRENASLGVEFYDLLHGNFTTGATVTWSSGAYSGTVPEVADTGAYLAQVNTTNFGAGTFVITIRANKTGFTTSITTITVVVLSLSSDMTTINPSESLLFIPRGGEINITVYLIDLASGGPVLDAYVTEVLAVLEGYPTPLVYNGTPGYYTGQIPAGGPTILDIGSSYIVQLSANLVNYVPAADSFKISLLQTQSVLLLAGGTTVDEEAFYSELVNFTVHLNAPDLVVDIDNATVTWVLAEKGLYGNLTSLGYGGFFMVTFNTTEVGFGIWGLSFRATPNNPIFSSSSTRLSLAIKRIPTEVIRPSTVEKSWGWSGNLSFTFDAGRFGPVLGAQATYSWGTFGGNATDLGNGTYIIPVDTSLVSPGSYTLTITFVKENYQEGPASVTIIVNEVGTLLVVHTIDYTPTYSGTLDDFSSLLLPIGDSVTITFSFLDVDPNDGSVGGLGLEGALPTENSYLRGPSIESYLNVTLIEIGGGLYSFTFDSTDAIIAALVSPEAYRLYIQIFLENRKVADILIRIQVTQIPTELILTNPDVQLSFVNGNNPILVYFFNDTWHNRGISGASLNASSSSDVVIPSVRDTGNGYYEITLLTGTLLYTGGGVVYIQVGIGFYETKEIQIIIDVLPNDTDVLVLNLTRYGLPFGLVLVILLAAYVRVWSVPKKIRQINGQIKAIRKGKIPKPLTDVRPRQQITSDLFNDTFQQTNIRRIPSQMPEEPIPIDIPEMGELLVQLSILTSLSPGELDEFKADISKMKMSEQAAFVREVIEQEVIRTARREGKTVEQVMTEVAAEADKRIAGEASPDAVPAKLDEEPDTIPIKEVPRTLDIPEPPPPTRPRIIDDVIDKDDKLSIHEIEELKAKLIRKGVPEYEINTIVEQAKTLPRELVEELVRSIDDDRK
ncbi:MAG: hypothetical protein ACFFD3_12965, partial [Candidatus Thorarchaeota archaeon]